MNTRAKLPVLAIVMLLCGCTLLRPQATRSDRLVASEPTPGISTSSTLESPNTGALFRDVTREAGLHFQHMNGASGRFYYPETFGAGVVFFDYDGDGWLDLFLVNSGALPGDKASTQATGALYHNNRDGTFTDVTKGSGLDVPMYGMGACAGDYDNDGFADLYVTGLGRCYLFHNNGNGTFTDVARRAGVANDGCWATSCAWLDYDNDGLLDLFVCNYVKYRCDEEQVCHQGSLRTYCGPLVYQGDHCRLYRNLGHGRFQDVSHKAGIDKPGSKALGVAVWDFDGDGYPDIVVANDLAPNLLFRNRRNGTFEEIGAESGVAYGNDGAARSGMGIDVADTRNDGRCEIFISNFAREPNSFFTQWQTPFSFSDRTYEAGMQKARQQLLGFGLFFFDYDNDGWKDALVTNGHIQPAIARYEPDETFAQPPLLYHNRGNGAFDDVSGEAGTAFLTPVVGRGAAYGDYDNDGAPDVLLTSNNGPARLLHNEVGKRNGWLKIRLVGHWSNRDGIGAEVRVRVGTRTQRDQRRSGSSYLSGSTPILHFGLGDAKIADSVEVRWPSGKIDSFASVPGRQTLTIIEGSTSASTK